MKKILLYLIGLLLIPTLFLTSCDRGDDITTTKTASFTLMKDYMVANNLDIDKILVNADGVKFVTAPPTSADLSTFLAKYYIMDIRSAADFANGHIEGAINVPFANILTNATNAANKPILVVCYTGQTACYGTALLRLYGYSNAQALKWGMAGWNSATAGSWNNNIGNPADGSANWTYSVAPSNLVFSDPTITSFSTDGGEILKERVEQVIADGFKGVNGSDVLASPSDYFVNNYFSAADYQAFGHVANAYRINPIKLADNSYLGLDPSSTAKVATYCYTGQTSAVITAILRVLGYDAYSIKFGMNGLYNSNSAWVSNKWSSSVPKNLPLVN
jgi:rhodanese-related sulfurtransferase